MPLEEKLLKIGREANTSSLDCRCKAIQEMVRTCFGSLNLSTTNASNLSTYKSNLSMIDKTFRKVVKQLKSEGIDFVKENGLQIFINSKSDLKQLHY